QEDHDRSGDHPEEQGGRCNHDLRRSQVPGAELDEARVAGERHDADGANDHEADNAGEPIADAERRSIGAVPISLRARTASEGPASLLSAVSVRSRVGTGMLTSRWT